MQNYAGSWQVVTQGRWKRWFYQNAVFKSFCFLLLYHVSLKYLYGEKHLVASFDINLLLQSQWVSLNPQPKRVICRDFREGCILLRKCVLSSLKQRIFLKHFRRNTALLLSSLLLTFTSVSKLTHQVNSSCWQPHIVVKTQCDKNVDWRKKSDLQSPEVVQTAPSGSVKP